MRKEEYLVMVPQALKNVKQPEDIDIEAMQRHIEEQYALIEEMQQWLDRFLKKLVNDILGVNVISSSFFTHLKN
jgi:type I restriction-modification system DNA methylase subunit